MSLDIRIKALSFKDNKPQIVSEDLLDNGKHVLPVNSGWAPYSMSPKVSLVMCDFDFFMGVTEVLDEKTCISYSDIDEIYTNDEWAKDWWSLVKADKYLEECESKFNETLKYFRYILLQKDVNPNDCYLLFFGNIYS